MSRSFGGRNPGEDRQTSPDWGSQAQPPESSLPPDQTDEQAQEEQRQSDSDSVPEPRQIDLGKRLVAGLIDVMAGYVLGLAASCIPFVNTYIHDQLALVGFLVIRDALFNGRGVGKNLMGLQVVDIKNGMPASFLQSIKRNMVVFGPYLALYLVNLLLKIVPNEMVGTVVTNVVTGLGQLYTLAVIPYEAWRVCSRADGLRWGDKVAGTRIVQADMDFSNPLSR